MSNIYSIYTPVKIADPNNTVSVSSSTGALVVSGGIGVGDDILIKNNIGSLGYMYSAR